ncbi:DNA gyrase subunit A [Anaerocolumna jejuensis DSM 15929]|uniref:DNA topoisomerase (ATP-hydrolyzing) n=1 Tax=Anaerocolumna jejuensis DSM 15929 TaxID=1121322 RepID=A0A1M7B6S8_9FIRM|nr:DNA topoisomerase (ATP-hydrolyzing) [Anaerocolumna jejuensis]SHL50692.1 DNA gyrase subunit A [Anaerocolumna jejuensis DSM 15929]
MKQNTENIIQLDYSEEMRNSYRDYATSVIVARALPDVRDGLKPVQRRILYAMRELGLDPAKPHRKSARIVGDTMGKYHPHGDSSIYDALVRMTEDYSMSIPLVDGHGNFGSIDGDGSAAMRYTEARLSEGAMTMLDHLEKGLVPFIPNFDDSEKEPVVLPAMIPNLLINGTTGIAVGMATNMPPHNPAEVIDGAIAYLDNPGISLEKLMKYIPGPDFPTGGIIINQEDIRNIYETGEGKIRLRAATEIENGENGRKNIIITEIPYTVAGNKTKLVENLVNLMKDKVFDEIYDVRDESSKEGIRIVIEVKKDRDTENLLNGLYKKTLMEDTYGVNMLAVKDQQPITFSLKALLKEFVVFQEELYTKEYEHLLAKAENRLEIVDGLIRATDVIDLIIEILRGSSSIGQAKACLIQGDITDIKFKSKASEKQAKTLDFTERQAEAILSMPLSRLIGLEILKLHEENDALKKSIDEYKLILSDSSELYKVIKNHLKDYKKAFNIPRRTMLTSITNVDYVEEVKIEDIYILIDRFGYTKSIDTVSYSRLSEDTLNEYPHIILCKNTDKLCLFTAEGNMYQVKAAQIPKCKIKDKGALIHTLCKVDKENILTYTSFEQLFESQLVFSTKAGYIKLVSGIEFETNRTSISSTKLEPEDEIVNIIMLSAGEALAKDSKVIILTEKGLSLGFLLAEIPEMKKTGRGVKSIEMDKADSVVLTVIPKATDEVFLYKEKELSVKKVRLRKRGQKGQKAQL